jgi:hypothetical protein
MDEGRTRVAQSGVAGRADPSARVEGHWGLTGEPPVDVEVTVLSSPPRPTARERIGSIKAPRRAHLVLAVVLGAAAMAAVLSALSLTGGGRDPIREASAARQRGSAGVAAAYGYPLRCLSVTIPLDDPRFARADFDRALRCGQFTGNPTAIFKRVHGWWRPLLDAVTYSCPVRSMPPRVQTELAVCG